MPDRAEFRRHAGLAQVGDGDARVVLLEDRVHVGPQFIAIDAHRRHQQECVVGEADLVLHVHGGRGGRADGEVAYRENIRQHRIADRPGIEVADAAIALLPGFRTRDIEAVTQRVADATGVEVLVEIRLHAVQALVEVEFALAAFVCAGGGASHFHRILRGLAVLAVDLPVEAVGDAGVERIHLVRQRHARAGLVVVAGDQRVGRAGQRLQSVRGQHVGVCAVLVAFRGQAEALLGARREHQLREQAAAVALLRVRFRPRRAFAADRALVPGFLSLAIAHGSHARPAFAAERGRSAAEQAVPTAFMTELEPEVGIPAGLQIVRGILGDERHHAAECVGAVKRTGRAAHHFDALERVEVDEVAVGVGEAADGERVRHRDAIGLDAHAIAFEPADADAADAETPEAGRGGDARFVAEQVLQVAHQGIVHALAVDHVDRVGHVDDGALGAGGGNDDAIELGYAAICGRRRRRRGGSFGVGGFAMGDGHAGQRQAQREGQQVGTHVGLDDGGTIGELASGVAGSGRPWRAGIRRHPRRVDGRAEASAECYLVRISLSLRVWRRR